VLSIWSDWISATTAGPTGIGSASGAHWDSRCLWSGHASPAPAGELGCHRVRSPAARALSRRQRLLSRPAPCRGIPSGNPEV